MRENKRVPEFVGYAYKLEGLPARRICGSAADLKRDGLVLHAVGIIPPRARKGKEKNYL